MEPIARPVGFKEAGIVFFVTLVVFVAACGLFGGCGSVQETVSAGGGAGGAASPQGGAGASGRVGTEPAGGARGLGNDPGTGVGTGAAGTGGAGGAAGAAGAAGSSGGAGGARGVGVDAGAAGQCGGCSENQICWHGLCACRPPTPGAGNTSGTPCGVCPGSVHYCPGACLPIGVDPDCS